MTGVKSSSNSILDFLLLRGKAEILANVFSSSDSSLCLLASFFLFRSFPPAGRVHGEQQGATVGDDQHRVQALVHDGVLQDLAEPGVQGDVQQVQPQGRDLLPEDLGSGELRHAGRQAAGEQPVHLPSPALPICECMITVEVSFPKTWSWLPRSHMVEMS